MKIAQDVVVLDRIKDSQNKVIGEIGGGLSRLIPILSERNACFNIDRFEGVGNGPRNATLYSDKNRINCMIGEFSELLKPDYFDILFSISVVEHVSDSSLEAFFDDCARILKPGGIMIHAIDMYLSDQVLVQSKRRLDLYSNILVNHTQLEAIDDIYSGDPTFTCDLASNSDEAMYMWNKISPELRELRNISQSVSLLYGARKSHG